MIRRILLLASVFLFAFCCSTRAQQADSLLYKRFPNVPPFTITQLPDSTPFSKRNLKKNKPVLIYIFSPDCEHCIAATRNMIEHYEALHKKVQIVMATPLEYQWIVPFYEKFNFAELPGITIGRDPSNFLGTFFNVKNYPAIFLYDKKGKFSRAYGAHHSFTEILKDL